MSIRIKLIDPLRVSVSVQVIQAPETDTEPEAPATTDGALLAVPVATLRLSCRYKGPNALGEWLDSFKGRTTVDVLAEVVEGFAGSVAESGQPPLEFSRAALAALLDQVKPAEAGKSLFLAIVDGYLQTLAEAAAKN